MGNLKITDLVDQKSLDDLVNLNQQLQTAKTVYAEAAQELSKGIKMKIEGLDDLERMQSALHKSTEKANHAAEDMNEILEKQQKVVHETSNEMSRKLAEQEKENKAKRESYKQDKKALDIAHNILGSQKDNYRMLAKLNAELKTNSEEQKKLNKAEEEGTISAKNLVSQRSELLAKEKELKTAKAELNKVISNEEKMNQAAEGSYKKLSLQLELLKKAYKELNEVEKNGDEGKILSEEISNLDAHLKDLAADMGEFQRNVGNYAIAQGKYSETIQEKLFGLIGISEDTGNSLVALGQKGGAGFSALTTKVQAFGKAMLTLLANPAVLAMLGIAGTVVAFKWIYDYNVGLAEATKLTHQFTGATGDMLKNQRNEVQALADMYDKDFQEVLISTNALAKQFGISFDEAFGYVKDGFVSGADVTGEFLDNVKEYPAYFKEAGISASQFIAITTQANQAGIYSDKGIDVIKEGNLRIREMTQATRDALEGIGISSEQVMKDLENGSKTTFDVMQMVSAKLEEYPESSAAVGTAIADIFGGPGEDAGLQYIKTLKDIDTNMDTVKAKAGRMAELQEEQLKSEMELQNNLSALFDFTGGTFEEMTTSLKVFVNNGISALIRGIVDVVNYFIDLYNESVLFRGIWQGIVANFKNGFDTIGNIFNLFIDVVKATGKMLKGAFTLDWAGFKRGLTDYARAFPNLVKAQVKDMKANFKEGLEDMQKKVKPITVPVKVVTPTNEKVEKVNNLKKGIKGIRNGDRDAVSSVSTTTTTSLIDAFDEEAEKENINNRLAIVEEGSEEELKLRLRMLEIERDAELRNIEKTGADRKAIEDKYAQLKIEEIEHNSSIRVAKLQEQYAIEETMAGIAYTNELAALKKMYADGLISSEEFSQKKEDLENRYAESTAKRGIALLEEQLSVENLSAEERESIEMELAKAKADYEEEMADKMIEATNRQKNADRQLAMQRISNAAEALNAIEGLANAFYERKQQHLDEESERVQAEYDSEIERIEHLAEIGAITTEDAEERKRNAEAKTQAKNEEIDQKKRKLQMKQAIWNKANQLAQTGIATARGIMEALASLRPGLAAFIGAMGAVQAATIIATPIPKYAKGTDSHPGGLAIVGDGGKQEVVVYDGKAFVTSDKPTLVNLPRGAEVLPDARMLDAARMLQDIRLSSTEDKNPNVVVNNDYSELERLNRETTKLLRVLLVRQDRIAHRQEYNHYKDLI